MSKPIVGSESASRDCICLRAFGNIATHWEMNAPEQRLILGVDDEKVLQDWMEHARARDDVSLPKNGLEVIGYVLSIYASLVILLNHDRSKDWVRAPNRAPLFQGKCAMSLMTSGDPKDLENVARYLLSERYR